MGNKILVIDDDPGILEALTLTLEVYGYSVETASSLKEVYEKIAKINPSLILLDVLLSGIDGRDICRKLKSNGKKAIPIIMISAHPDVEKSVHDAGADAFISKPFEMNDLLAKIQAFSN